MFIIHVTYKAPLEEIDKYLPAHREFLDYYFLRGQLVASGPLKPRTGGIILAIMPDRETIDAFIQKDPFFMAEIADYEVFEFTPNKHCEALKNLIEKTEGKLW